MLTIIIPELDGWDENRNEFISLSKRQVLQLEHSLVSLSKWESKWCKPFLTKTEKSVEETLDYIRCMTITQNVDPNVYNSIGQDLLDEIGIYIDAPMTATTFTKNEPNRINRDIITAEIIYFWMITLQIPSEYQKWHLNKLLTLIEVCNIKNQPPSKLKQSDIINRNRNLNAERRKQFNSSG